MTLLETLSCLLIAILVVGGSILMTKKAIESDKINRAVQNLSTFRLDAKNLYKGEPDFTGLTTAVAVNNEIVPDEMLKSNGDVRNVWNGLVTLAAGADPTTFVITQNDIPKYACVKLARSGSWEALSINGVEIDLESGVISAINDNLQDSNTIVFTSN
ncbi:MULTISPECIES: type 4 pilus major pilin [unclassified Maridesulfovibrio]|uniref:type 4 pilus major pilin n=1 Tax=unclassified Maridesulfovibrio TaxID=2794999 RepID=UPI003B3CBFD4